MGSIERWTRFALSLLLALGAVPAAPAQADDSGDDTTLTEIVEVLRERGLIDEEQHTELAAKAAREDAKRAWVDRVSIWGDFRGRLETFQFEQDVYTRATGGRLQDRTRGRYRARLGVQGEVTSRATVVFGLASGDDDPRSTNQTLGDGPDFDTDDIRFDLAYVTVSPFPDAELPGVEGGYLALDAGKVKNPFLWKALGFDAMLVDNDVNPEGASLRIRGETGPLALFANSGVYVIDENSGGKDPKLLGGQLGGALEVAPDVSVGARGTLYHFFSLDDDFFARAASSPSSGGTGGNLLGGLASGNHSIQVLEGSAFVELGMSEWLPVLVFGSYAQNLSARRSPLFPGVDREDTAWAAGVFVGDPGRLVRLGFVFVHVEANAFPSMFLDSDFLDGTPNREGYLALIEREITDAITVSLKGFSSKRIEGGPAFAESGPGADRLRGQADVVFEF